MKKFGKFKWPPLVQHQCHNCGAKFEVCLSCSRRITEDDAEFLRKIAGVVDPKVTTGVRVEKKNLRTMLRRFKEEQIKVEEELGIIPKDEGLDKYK